MENLVRKLESLNERAGRVFAWSSSLLVWLICADVVMRYCFNFTLIWVIELETYLFALVIMMASGYAFRHDRHVRVDVFYSTYSEKKKAWINLVGGVCLLLPWCLISSYVCFYYFLKSVRIGESSPQPGGLPALYCLKFILFAGFLLLLVQAIASILKSIITIRSFKSS